MSVGLVGLPLDDARIAELDRSIAAYVSGAGHAPFDLIGAGELTCVIGWRGWAFKLLPPVHDRARVEAYGALLDEYLQALRSARVPVVETSFALTASERGVAGYIVQPRLPAEQLLSKVVQHRSAEDAVQLFNRLLDHVDACVARGIGIDPQLSNWMMIEGEPQLIDISTPMLRDADGRDRLDTEFFVALLPRMLQGVVRRFMVADLLEKNFDHRQIVLDLIGTMANYGLERLTEPFVTAANERLERPLTVREVERYRREDTATWWVLRRAFAVEQWWRRRVTRAPSLHLVPAHFDRAH